MDRKKPKVIRRPHKESSPNPHREKPSRESWDKLKEVAAQKGWIKKP